MSEKKFEQQLLKLLNNKANPFHPLVFINGEPDFGENVSIGFFSEVNAKQSQVIIGADCDIASFVAINVADSHKRCIGMLREIERRPIIIEHHVFVGSHSVIKGGAHIGHHSVVAAGSVVDGGIIIPPYSLVTGNPMKIKKGYYRRFISPDHDEGTRI